MRFRVGEDPDRALVRVRSKIDALADVWPRDVPPPVVKPRSIDDVPIWALTFWSPTQDSATLRQIAAEVENEIKSIPEVSDTALIGGLRREFRVELDPARLAARGLAAGPVLAAIEAANRRTVAGEMVAGDRGLVVEAGGFLESARELGSVVVAERGGRPVRLSDVATVADGPERPVSYVTHGEPGRPGRFTAVTLAVSKRRGANAISVVHAIERKLAALEPRLLAADVRTTVTRDYGETSSEKSNELLKHMALATLSVALLMALALGRREAGVVLLAVPVTLALTLFVFMLFGYTLNRITLFALIFSIGILVDDAIVVVENIVRHLRLPSSRGRPLARIAVEATDEVGNPTILATFAVIAAIVPMGFVGGLMGPYMRPIPVGASAAMLFSLLVAFAISPWAARRLFRGAGAGTPGHGEGERSRLAVLYRKAMTPLVSDGGRRSRAIFFGVIAALLLAAFALVPLGVVTVKMLPFDNKNEFQVVVDLPDGTTLETTHRVLSEMAGALAPLPEVTGTEVYAGAAAPYNFNGLVRHYFLRSAPHQGDVQVSLAPKGKRSRSSHAIARAARTLLEPIARRYDARIKVAEVPPGPPVLQTLVAEIYGPDDAGRREVARQVRDVFRKTEGVVDVDWYLESPREKVVYRLDREKAGLSGIREADVAATLRLALSSDAAGEIHLPGVRERIPLRVTLPDERRHDLSALGALSVADSGGRLVPLSEIGRFENEPAETSIYHKNLKPVVYVTADVAGRREAPGVRDRGAREGHRGDRRAGRIPHRDAHGHGALRHGALRAQVGRRVARDVRGLPRPRPRLRGGPGPDLRARRRLVQELHGAARHHGADPADARRDPAGARALRRVLHGDLDDRLHRRRRHHRAQLDHPRRLHRAAAARGHGALRSRARRGRGALPPDAPDGGRRRRGLGGDAARSDLPGPGGLDDGGGGGRDAPVAGRRAGPLLHAQTRGREAGASFAGRLLRRNGKEPRMTRTIDEWLRGIAGIFILASLALGWLVHPGYFLFTAFVGLNLLQSLFTRWCPMMWLLQRLGVEQAPARS